jgi:hypothetical protein
MPKDVIIKVLPVEINMSSEAFHFYAIDYYECYAEYLKKGRFSPVPYTLLFHVIELEIKSLLLKSGERKVRHYTHDLIKAYNALNPADKILTSTEIELLRKSTPLLLKKDFQYFLPIALFDSKYMPDLKQLDVIAVKLIQHNNLTYKYETTKCK